MPLHANAKSLLERRKIQIQLCEARLRAGVSVEDQAAGLGVSPKTLRDWELCHDWPSLANAFLWVHQRGFEMVLTRPGAVCPLADVEPEDGVSWALQQFRRLTPELKRARRARGLSCADMAARIGVHKTSLELWERGRNLSQFLALIVWAQRLNYTLILRER